MNRHMRNSIEMVANKNKSKVLSCSTPEHQSSPSRDSDSICDSEAASPVPFLCTQDGAEGETDVVWNFYTPKSEHAAKSRVKNSTPLSRRSKRISKPVIEKQLPKRRPLRAAHKKTELFQDLIELNQNLHELMAKKSQNNTEKVNSASEDDIFNDSPEYSPKSALRSNSRCLRRNVLSSNFVKPDPEAALESDDSINECLIKASQVVEEKMLAVEPALKRPCYESNHKYKNLKTDFTFKMDQDSMDAILNSIKLDSPIATNVKKCNSPQLNNDSFDSFVGNLNDSALDRLTQMPNTGKKKNGLNTSKGTNWSVKEVAVHGSPSSKSIFSRHSSMPESPTVVDVNKPSSSGMVFGRYNSMPFGKESEKNIGPGDSPIRCTPDEIKKKHQLAREKLMAKRLLPFTSSQKTQPSSQMSQQPVLTTLHEQPKGKINIPQTDLPKKIQFQPKVSSMAAQLRSNSIRSVQSQQSTGSNTTDIKSIIEKKRQEALMKLRRRQVQSKAI